MFKQFARTTANTIKTIDRTGQIQKELSNLAKKDVLIGVPEQETVRTNDDNEPVNNAQLAYIHSHGAPRHNIPARPFLQPSIEENIDKVLKLQKKAFNDALEGTNGQVETDLRMLGLLGSTLAKDWFTDPRNNWPPNAPSTIAKKGSDRPLIDTGQLRNSITYVVRDNRYD